MKNIQRKIEKKIAFLSYPLLATKNSYALYSMNSTVVYVLENYAKQCKDKEIYYATDDNSRDTRYFAGKLTEIGYQVKLCTNEDIMLYEDKWDVLLTSADFICRKGIGSRKGTSVLAKFCRTYKKSWYVFADSSKFLLDYNKNAKLQPGEDSGRTIDIIPFRYMTYCVTERRLYTPQDIIAYFDMW